MFKAFILSTLLAATAFCSTPPQANAQKPEQPKMFSHKARVDLGGKTFALDVAATLEERNLGLIGRPTLRANEGIIFVGDQDGYRLFRTKGLLFYTDILWVSGTGQVVWLETNVPPCQEANCPSYSSVMRWRHLIQLPSGTVTRQRINIGDQLAIAF